jgi:ribosome biogenesis GTPase
VKSIRKDEIAWSRYNSYLKLLGDDENYRTDIHNEDQLVTKTENSKDLICQSI